MASIVKRKNRYSVVYTYTDENGVKRQKWETFATNAEAKKRKVQVEFEQETGTFIIPNASTVSDLLEEYMSIYGVNTWAMSTYEARRSLIFNYINPLIGDMKLEDVTPRTMDKYYQSLLTVKAKVVNNRKPTHEYLTAHGKGNPQAAPQRFQSRRKVGADVKESRTKRHSPERRT